MACDNVPRLLHILSASHKLPPDSGLLFLDAEKAFDRLEGPFLWRTMKEFKLGDKFMKMIQTLYANPSARVCVGGGMSEFFDIRRGTRQGDPMSPLLFTLSIEPLAHLIRNSSTISPITIGSTSHSISLYADDTLVYLANVQQTLPCVLTTLEHFGYLSGYKVNLSKSALMLINTDKDKISLPAKITVINEVLYLGIRINTSPMSVAKLNYSTILEKIEEDINRWKHLPSSVPARISVIKMNILPRINFVSSMIPLAPPVGYWKKLEALLRGYVWNGKRPQLKWSALQVDKMNGGMACPNFKLYHWVFVLRSFRYWIDEDYNSAWKNIEEELIAPVRLKDFPLTGVHIKRCTLHYGPILTYMIQVFRAAETFINFKNIWCKSSPLWNNSHLLSGGKPFINKHWEAKGINTLQDINGADTILNFQELISQYNIDKHSLFFYFRIRSACRAYMVPWGSELKQHLILSWLQHSPKQIVSYLYDRFNSQKYTPTPGMKAWDRDITDLGQELDWETIWDNVSGASKNPNHRYMHLKFCHRAYVTPRIRHLMGFAPDPYCSFCPHGTLGSFLHVMWECPEVSRLWRKVIEIVTDITGVQFPMDPAVHLLNDDSHLSLAEKNRKVWLAGLTAAKKIVVQRWKSPHDISTVHWLRSFLDISYMELSSTRVNNAQPHTLAIWENLISKLKDLLLM